MPFSTGASPAQGAAGSILLMLLNQMQL